MATREERQAWQRHHRQQMAYEREWRGKIFRALRRQKKPVYDFAKTQTDITRVASSIEVLIKPDELAKVLTRLYSEITQKEAREYYAMVVNLKAETMLGLGQSVDWLADVQEYLRQWLGAQITRMTDYTKRVLLAFISEGVQNGDSYDQIIARMRSVGIDQVRASNIARTETNRALASAKFIAAERLPYKVNLIWVAARDKRTRGAEANDKADHFDLNGQVRPQGTPFRDIRSGALMLFPGDVSMGAGAADVCNCRCTLITKRAAGQPARTAPNITNPVTLVRPQNYSELPLVEKLRVDKKIIAQRLGMADDEFEVKIGKTPNNIGGFVEFVKTPNGNYEIGKNITISNTLKEENASIYLAHEMRHIYQTKFKGYYANKDGIFWEGKLYMTTRQYNTVVNALKRAKTQDEFDKAGKKYDSLPWEKDANEFMNINIKLFSVKGIIDLIELPDELKTPDITAEG